MKEDDNENNNNSSLAVVVINTNCSFAARLFSNERLCDGFVLRRKFRVTSFESVPERPVPGTQHSLDVHTYSTNFPETKTKKLD